MPLQHGGERSSAAHIGTDRPSIDFGPVRLVRRCATPNQAVTASGTSEPRWKWQWQRASTANGANPEC